MALTKFGAADFADKAGLRICLRIAIVQAIDVLYESERLAPETLGQQKGSCISAVRWYSSGCRWMLPKRIGRNAIENHPWRALDKKRQEMAEDVGRNCDDAIWRQQRTENMRVAERVSHSQLRKDAGRQS